MAGRQTTAHTVLSRALRLAVISVAGAVVSTVGLGAGIAAGAPPVVPPVPGVPEVSTPTPTPTPATTPAAGLPICLPGQESAPLSGSGTPAPLGNLQGLPADLAAGGSFGGVGLSAEQVRMAATVIAVGKQMGITRRGIEIALSVATEQSSLRPEALNKDWLGLFQQNPINYTQYRRTEPGGASWMFYDQLVKRVPGYDSDARPNYEIGDIVQQTRTAERFAEYQDMAADLAGRLTDAVSLHQDDVTCVPAPAAQASTGSGFAPGSIISDAVFYNASSMTADQIRVFLRGEGEGCTGALCLKNLAVNTPNMPADRYCAAYQGAMNEDAAAVLEKVSTACGVSPQVMLVTLQKESGLVSRTDPSAANYNAAWGWHCPDTGPGGSANCDPAYAGFFNQAYGMAKQWTRYRLDPDKYHYRAGQTTEILWNVAESGCGGGPVAIQNTATAALYNYTPYQPNAAALAAYPGTGDKCSAYGNRNFFYLFRKYFGSTGGGSSTTAPAVLSTGTTVKVPSNQYVSGALAGQTITAPNAAVAAGLAAGFSALGLPYVWGGGGSGAGPNNGCVRGGGANNSCGAEVGFDCSGLTAYVLGMAGYRTPGDSGAQRAAGESISWAQALPGDIVGFPGHVAVYLGTFGGRPYILEASWVGTPIHIVPLTRTDFDDRVHRYWTGPAVSAPKAADFSAVVRAASMPSQLYTYTPRDPGSFAGPLQRSFTPTITRIKPRPWPSPVIPSASLPTGAPSAGPQPAEVPGLRPAGPAQQAPAQPTPVSTAPVSTAPGTVTPAPSSPAPSTPAPSPAAPSPASSRTAPSSTAPSTAAPSSTAPSTAAPSSTAPSSTGPPSSPRTTVPKSTVPTTAPPKTTVPTTTPPQTTVPQTTVPQTTVPQTTVPQTTVPKTALSTVGSPPASGPATSRPAVSSSAAPLPTALTPIALTPAAQTPTAPTPTAASPTATPPTALIPTLDQPAAKPPAPSTAQPPPPAPVATPHVTPTPVLTSLAQTLASLLAPTTPAPSPLSLTSLATLACTPPKDVQLTDAQGQPLPDPSSAKPVDPAAPLCAS